MCDFFSEILPQFLCPEQSKSKAVVSFSAQASDLKLLSCLYDDGGDPILSLKFSVSQREQYAHVNFRIFDDHLTPLLVREIQTKSKGNQLYVKSVDGAIKFVLPKKFLQGKSQSFKIDLDISPHGRSERYYGLHCTYN